MIDWVPLNLTESRAALQRWNTMDQRGQWMVGFHQGASGAVLIGGEPPAFADGFACGERAHNDSATHRDEVSERRRESAKKRWNRDDDANAHANAYANAHANAHANATPFASCKTHAQDKTRQDKTRQDKTEQEQQPPKAPPGGRRTAKITPVAPDAYDGLYATIIPDYLKDAENLSQWHEWVSFRNEHRQGKGRGAIVPVTEAAAKQSLRLMAKAKKSKSVSSMIISAISGEWDGLHVPYGAEEDFYK